MPNSIRYSAAMFFLRLAWRNLWRNKKRTLIAAASVFFAVFLAVAMSSTTSGQHDSMIHSAVSMYTGHVQVHGRGYWEKRSLDQSMPINRPLLRAARALPGVACATTRLETGALVSCGARTKVSPVIGIDPVSEHAMTGLGKRVVRGTPYGAWKSGAIVAEGLARLLNADVGDSIVVYGQGYQGVTAARVVRIASIAHFPIPDLDNAMVYLPLSEAQDLFSAQGRATAIAVLLRDEGDEADVAAALRSLADAETEVMTWREMMPELLQAIDADTGGTVIMLLILYVVIGFGIFGTVMMMTAERSREFGITIAVGMQRGRLIAVTVLEAIIVSMLGALAGIAASIPVLVYFTRHPIVFGGDYAKAMLAYGMEPILALSLDPMVFAGQGLIVFALGVVSALYPVFVLRRLEPVRAMRG
jgi:ABC-type lipoprotein release transport system permease subunit